MNAARPADLVPARFAVLVDGTLRGGVSFPEYMDAIRKLLGLRKGDRRVVGLDAAGQAHDLDESAPAGTRLGVPIPGVVLAPATRAHLTLVK